MVVTRGSEEEVEEVIGKLSDIRQQARHKDSRITTANNEVLAQVQQAQGKFIYTVTLNVHSSFLTTIDLFLTSIIIFLTRK